MKNRMYVVGSIGTNCYLVWDEESCDAMLIDPGDYDPLIENAIANNGLVLKYISLTHGHFDHIGGVRKFKESFPAAVFAASAGERDLLGDLKPELELSEGDTIKLGSLVFEVIETPGHTPGGLCFYVGAYDEELLGESYSGTLFSGDTLFHASIGRTDLDGGDFNTLKASILEKLYKLPDDTIVLPGHLDATTIGYEKRYNMFVR